MRADRFHPLLTARGPFVSVYFDDSHDTADAAAQINARWRDLYKHGFTFPGRPPAALAPHKKYPKVGT